MYCVELHESLLNVKYVMLTLLRVMKASNIVYADILPVRCISY